MGRTTGPLPNLPPAKAGKYFKHIVLIIQENRTYDNLFATFPGGDGVTVGKGHNGQNIPLERNRISRAAFLRATDIIVVGSTIGTTAA